MSRLTSWIGRRELASIVTAVVLAPMSSCFGNGGGGTGDGQATSDSVSVSVQYRFPSGGARTCTGDVTWVYSPLNLTGSHGRSAEIVERGSYNVPASAGQCTFHAGQRDLKKGTWRIAGTTVPACDVKLQASSTSVGFNHGVAGCTTFP